MISKGNPPENEHYHSNRRDSYDSRLSFAASDVTNDDDENDDAFSTTTTTSEIPQMALAANGLISHAMLRELLQNPRATSAFSFVSNDEGVEMKGVVSIASAVATPAPANLAATSGMPSSNTSLSETPIQH